MCNKCDGTNNKLRKRASARCTACATPMPKHATRSLQAGQPQRTVAPAVNNSPQSKSKQTSRQDLSFPKKWAIPANKSLQATSVVNKTLKQPALGNSSTTGPLGCQFSYKKPQVIVTYIDLCSPEEHYGSGL